MQEVCFTGLDGFVIDPRKCEIRLVSDFPFAHPLGVVSIDSMSKLCFVYDIRIFTDGCYYFVDKILCKCRKEREYIKNFTNVKGEIVNLECISFTELEDQNANVYSRSNRIMDKEHKNYPSRYKIGEKVVANFGKNGRLENVFIRAIIFTNAKVRYSIFLSESNTTLHNVDSCFVEDVEKGQEKFIEFETDNYS